MRLIFSMLVAVALVVPSFSALAAEPVPANRAVTPAYNVDIHDPIEPFNRAVFQFNRAVDFLVIKPVAMVYGAILPQFVRNGISNFLGNLLTPVVMVNTLLQGDWTGFETTLHRMVVNTTLGMGGVNDVASHLGLARVHADFGQTLGKWGLGQGFYIVFPIIGSTSVRDGTGLLVDNFAFDPYNIIFMNSGTDWPLYARAGTAIVSLRDRYGKEYDDIMKTSVDPYVTFRSMYAQRRNYMVQGKTAGGGYDAYDAAE